MGISVPIYDSSSASRIHPNVLHCTWPCQHAAWTRSGIDFSTGALDLGFHCPLRLIQVDEANISGSLLGADGVLISSPWIGPGMAATYLQLDFYSNHTD